MDRAEAIKIVEKEREFRREMAAKWSEVTGKPFDHLPPGEELAERDKNLADAFDMAIAALREQEQSKWISDRLPTEDECNRAIVGVVNGYNGRITFTDAEIFVCYDFKEKDWYSEDYDIEGCKVRCWMPLPEPPKEGADHE